MKHIESFLELKKVIDNILKDKNILVKIENLSEEISETFEKGKKVLICGNGGSAADSMHFAEEFTGNFSKKRRALPVIPLTESSHITCVGNDFGFEDVFSRLVEAYGENSDYLIVLSTSGNSKNIIKAVLEAKKQGMKVFALLGKGGGKLAKMDINTIIVPSDTTSRIQEIHQVILHSVIEKVEEILYKKGFLK